MRGLLHNLPDDLPSRIEQSRNLEERSDAETDAQVKKAFEQRLQMARAEDEANKRAARSAEEYAKAIREGMKAASERAEKSLAWAESSGQISHQDAAIARAIMHGRDYLALLKELNSERAKLLTDPQLSDGERQAKLQENSNAMAKAAGDYTLQKSQDNNDPYSAISGVHQFWQSVISDADNAAQTVKSLMSQALNSLNGELVKGIMGKKADWGKAFEGEASSTLNAGLKQGEGMIGKGESCTFRVQFLQERQVVPAVHNGTRNRSILV